MGAKDFFPPGSLNPRPDLHVFAESWYASHLIAMEEEPLYPPAADRPPTYRLLHLPTFHQPSLVRLTEVGGVWRTVSKRTDGQGGYFPGKLVGTAERELTRAEAKRLGRLLDRVGFWEMAPFEECLGVDGEQCIAEGVRAGHYHVVDRWSPQGAPYAELVEFLLGLASGVGDPPANPPKYLGSFAELADRLRARQQDYENCEQAKEP